MRRSVPSIRLRLPVAVVVAFAVAALAAAPRARAQSAYLDDELPPGYPAPSAIPPQQYAPPQYPAYPSDPSYPPSGAWVPGQAPLVPQQVRTEEHRRWGLFGAGIGVFAGTWALNSAVAYLSGEGTLAVPVLGPLLLIDKLRRPTPCLYAPAPYGGEGDQVGDSGCGRPHDDVGDRLGYTLLVFDALVQTTGVVMAAAGLFSKTRVAVDDRPGLSFVAPFATTSSAGLAVGGRF